MLHLSRRQFLAATAASSTCAVMSAADQQLSRKLDVAFFLIGDTHYLANKEQPEMIDEVSARTNAQLIDQLNRLAGTDIPEAAGGGKVRAARGLIHAGDLIDSGDKGDSVHLRMQATEWAAFNDDFAADGKSGRLRLSVYEVHGNHDSPSGEGLAVKRIIERNKHRPGVKNVSDNGLHYSWDWDDVHFVNLGIVVGTVKEVVRKRRYNPLDSLQFLISDLAEHVGDSGRPVILTHHIDVARYSTDPNPAGPATSAEWDPADVRGYYEAIAKYNVAAILYGHTHARNIYRWNGTPKPAEQGVPTFNVDNSAHFGSPAQAMLYFHLHGETLTVRELATKDRWATCYWTPQVWTSGVAG
jgi:cytolysin (calcineurin-like family phosphatase)